MPAPLRRLLDLPSARPRLAAGAAAALAHAATLWNLPVLDDGWVVFQNPLVTGGRLARILAEPYNAGGPATTGGLWRPLTTLTYALNYAISPAVGGFHAVNLALHVAATLLVLSLARRLVGAVAPGRAGPSALAAALLFALHPVHVEAVASIVGRAELLAAVAALGAVHLASTRAQGRWRLPAAAAAVAAGVLCKENAAVAPLLFALVAVAVPSAAGLDARPGLAPGAPRRALASAAGVVAALAAGVAVYFLLRPGRGLGVPAAAAWFAGRPRGVVAGTMSRALAEYLRLLVFPHPLGVDFFYAQRIPFTPALAPRALAAAAVWGGALAAGALSLRRAPLRAVGILWVFAGLAPVLNVFPTGVLMAERLLYLPSAGFCVWAGDAAVAAWGRLRRPGARRTAAWGAAAILALLAGRTVTRGLDWRDARALWEAELAKSPLDPVVNNNLAVELNQAGEYARARERLAVTLRVAPWYWRAWVNLGVAQHRTGDLDAALASFERAAEIDPSAAAPPFFAALVRADLGDVAGAIDLLGRAEALAPEDARTRAYRGAYLLDAGRLAEARAELERALAIDPRRADARASLSRLEARERATAGGAAR